MDGQGQGPYSDQLQLELVHENDLCFFGLYQIVFEQHRTEESQPVEQFLRVLACFDGLPILGFDLVAMGGLLLCASDHVVNRDRAETGSY